MIIVFQGEADNQPAGLKIFMMEFDFPLHISSDIIGSSQPWYSH